MEQFLIQMAQQHSPTAILFAIFYIVLKFNDFRHVKQDNSENRDLIKEVHSIATDFNEGVRDIKTILEKQEVSRENGHSDLTTALQSIDKTQALMYQYMQNKLNGIKPNI
jgi:hypothetical protein